MGKAGVGITAGQDLILSANATAQIASGQDSQIASGGQARVQTGQAIGIWLEPFRRVLRRQARGLSVIAAQGDIEMQAQAGATQIVASRPWRSSQPTGPLSPPAKKVTLAVSGASITIEGGSFTAQCPGKITVQAGKKSMVGPLN